MANFVTFINGLTKSFKSTGVGTDGDPYVPFHQVADGSDVNQGTTTDAVVAAGAAGTLSAKIRRLTTDLASLLAKIPSLTSGSRVPVETDLLRVSTSNTASVRTNGSTDALDANSSRKMFAIQNHDTTVLKVYLKTGASNTVYHFILPACTSSYDGTSAPLFCDYHTGVVSVFSSSGSPKYTVLEL
jgi:hypothetical protein